jgi:hypothetical protein
MAGFPNSPSIGETYTLGTKVWEWDGTIWKIKTTGAVGPQGVQGAQGNQGTAGAGGVQGNQGRQGSVGPQGNQGRQGNQGNQGLQGLQGFQGNQGLKGDTGDTGPQGNQGNQGNQGLQGFQGNQGLKGDTGDTGPQGNQGRQGNQGVAGAISSISTEATGGSAVFVEGSNYYYNKFLTTKSDKTPLLGKYAEKFYDHGSPTSATAFDVNLENGNIHLINFVSAATGTTKYFTFSGYVTASDVSNLELIIRGGSNLTVDWGTNVYFSEETGIPVLGSTGSGLSGDWVFIPFVYIPSSNSFFGGSQLTFDL